jgi:hypothetical protein
MTNIMDMDAHLTDEQKERYSSQCDMWFEKTHRMLNGEHLHTLDAEYSDADCGLFDKG